MKLSTFNDCSLGCALHSKLLRLSVVSQCKPGLVNLIFGLQRYETTLNQVKPVRENLRRNTLF